MTRVFPRSRVFYEATIRVSDMTTEDQKQLENLKMFLFFKIYLGKLHSRTLERVIHSTSYFPPEQFKIEEIKANISQIKATEWESIQKFTSYQMIVNYFDSFQQAIKDNNLTVGDVHAVLFTKQDLNLVYKTRKMRQKEVVIMSA